MVTILMQLTNLFKNEFFKNLSIILLFIVFSFSLGIFKTKKIASTQDIGKIDFLINEDKIKKESIPTVIYIWATWCTICKANSYIIGYNYSIASALNINFISLEEGENKESLRNYLSQESIPYPLGLLNEDISTMYNISEFPTFIFLNKDNIVKLKDSGIINPLSFLLRLVYIKYF